MKCPLRDDGVHYLGSSTSCECGYTHTLSRFQFDITIHDNTVTNEIVNECFGCSHIETVIEKLEQIIANLKAGAA